jgi:hypothetical protein
LIEYGSRLIIDKRNLFGKYLNMTTNEKYKSWNFSN